MLIIEASEQPISIVQLTLIKSTSVFLSDWLNYFRMSTFNVDFKFSRHSFWSALVKIVKFGSFFSLKVQKYFGFLKTFFLHTKSFGCQRKSFRYRTKENFDTCLRSVGCIFTEIWHFLWKSTFWTSICLQFLTLLYVVLTWIGLTENGITQWLWVLQTLDRCQNFPWFHP